MVSVTVFGNFLIDTEERFLRLKDSFYSMKETNPSEWVVNVRGNYKHEVINFLTKEGVSPSKLFLLESSAGWFYDTNAILPYITSKFVFIWLEDHICMSPADYDYALNDMDAVGCEIMTYSWWENGRHRDRYKNVDLFSCTTIDYFDHTEQLNKKVQNAAYGESYIISLVSVVSRDLFKKILQNPDDDNRRWNPMTPFGFEKLPHNEAWLPIRRAVPRTELFAPIDDDLHTAGSSLIARDLYPERIKRQSYAFGPGRIDRLVDTIKGPIRIIRRLLSLLVIYAKCPAAWRKDFLASVSSAKTDANLIEIPSMNYSVIDYLSQQLKLDVRIFEYGSGSSSVYWAKRGASIVSVEHDKNFFLSQCSQLENFINLDYVLVEPQPMEVGQENFQSQETFRSIKYIGSSFEDYVNSIRQFPLRSFDVVTIGARARAACVRACVDWLCPGGLLILDNSDRTEYHQVISDVLSNWVRVDFRGPVRGLLHEESTSIFWKPHD
jgi:hypothetical protein